MKGTISIVAVIIIPLAVSCGGAKKSAIPLQEIKVTTVNKGTVERKVIFTGNIVAENAFDVYPRASGKVSKKLLREGDLVRRSQPILLVERDEVGYTFRPMPVVSPTDGVVGSIYVDVGTNVDLGHPVATVVYPGKMKVKLDVPERYLSAIQVGTEVAMEVDYLPGELFEGAIVTVWPIIDQKTRTARVEISLPNADGRLRHGMFGRLRLAVERHEGTLLVPIDAISWEGDKQFVYKVKGERVERAQVETGIRNDNSVELLSGVSEGDSVACDSLINLKDGEVVSVEPIPK